MALSLTLKITDAGRAAAFNAANTGIDVELTHVAFGSGFREPNGIESALINELRRVTISGGSRVLPDQVRLQALWASDTDESPITEIGIFSGAVLFAYWSRSSGVPIGYKTAGVDFVFYYDWALKEIPANTITIQVDPDAPVAMNALAIHEADPLAHRQYLRRSSVAQEASVFRWAGVAGGTADSIVLTLPAESYLTSYAAGQKFHFLAKFGNSGPASISINELGARSVRKDGTTALASGDIVGGRVYDVTFDGSNFQISSGLGSGGGSGGPSEGEVFYINSMIATAGQVTFEAPYDVGALMVFVRGEFVPPERFTATNGASIDLAAPCAAGDEVVVVTFRATAAANVYTKPQTYSRVEISSLLNGKQDNIGFTPVQQGGGAGQGTNKVRIGWNALLGMKIQVDNTDLGNLWYSGNFNPNDKANKATTLDGYGILNAYTSAQVEARLSTKQDNLGFVPIHQGYGVGHLTNTVYIGWSGAGLTAQVDSFQLGALWYDANGAAKASLAIATFGAGIVGSYGLFRAGGRAANSPIGPGEIFAGSSLRFANAEGATVGGAPVGTWRLMGFLRSASDNADWSTSLFLRIS